MRKLTILLALAVVATTACKKTGEGQYEVERPTVGTTTDTVRTPTVDVGTKQDTLIVNTPTIDVKKAGDTARKRP